MTFSSGTLKQRLRLYSGLILFAFVVTHFLNHALGLVSVEAMDAAQRWRLFVTRSLPGTIILSLALVVHIALTLYKFAERRTLRMSSWEAVQLVFGLAIPFLLFRHIIGTRIAYELYGVDDKYSKLLWLLWPGEIWQQSVLITITWVHACIGIHFWLRLNETYRKLQPLWLGIAVLIPVLAFAGFSVAGRNVRIEGEFVNQFTARQIEVIQSAFGWALWGAFGVLVAILLFRMVRALINRTRPKIKVNYADGVEVTTGIGPSLLEISRAWDIPHASVCGGRARCSTCRVRVLEGAEELDPPGEAEQKVLERVGAGPAVRLACQLHPHNDLTVATLLPAHRIQAGEAVQRDQYMWGVEQEVTVMFADLRGFTALSEERLPFDVVFLLNQYLGQMGAAIEDAGGHLDKFIGDGIMALFGIGQPVGQGARQALRAARSMGGVLEALNRSLADDLPEPLNIGIGLHTGPAILGRVGIPPRQGATQPITALGDTVNTSSRLESSCKALKVQLVVSVATFDAAGFDRDVGTLKQVRVKGKSVALDVVAIKRALDSPIAG